MVDRMNVQAEISRSHMLERIDEALMCLQADPPVKKGLPSMAQLTQLRATVQGLHEVGFASFLEQAMFYAVLIPYAAIGSSSLIRAWLDRLKLGL